MRTVFEAHEPRLRTLARRMLGNEQDAEEVAVATFLRFWRAAGRYRGECSLKAYLTRIALNLAKDRVRKAPPVLAPPPSAESPLMERIREGMRRMGPDDREILALYYLEEATYEYLMETLGVSYDVVRTRLVRARQRLRRVVGEDDERP
jgi:RNA polymerase sigma-70 factor (ECF subfamily)